jgi:hypothetical protein
LTDDNKVENPAERLKSDDGGDSFFWIKSEHAGAEGSITAFQWYALSADQA